MSSRVFARRSLAALTFALSLSLGLAATAQAEIPRQSPGHCRGQPILEPLQPLVIHTARGTVRFKVELADTPDTREYGLMCRTALAPDRGMLFDFGEPKEGVAFWMRNTLIGLDIIFIRPDGTILSIARKAKALDETPLPAGGVIRGVLEIPAGRAAQLGLKPGDKVDHRIFGS